ncbi:MAG: ATP-binding cassette domain-containing protein [Victivallaceae bacterium]
MTNKGTSNFLSVNALSKYYYKRKHIFSREKLVTAAVNNVSFTMDSGMILGLVGESGSGKTTLAMMLMGLIKPSSGQILFENTVIGTPQTQHVYKQDLRMIFQDPYSSLNPRKTILDNISHHLLYHRFITTREEQMAIAEKVMEKVGLSQDILSQYPHQLSGGMLQRVSIGRAIIGNAKLIVCDEIVSALDLSLQAQFLNMLKHLQHELKLGYLFISHDLSVVSHFCSHVLIMYKGQIVESGATQVVFDNPKNEYTKMLLKAQPATHPKNSLIRKTYSCVG